MCASGSENMAIRSLCYTLCFVHSCIHVDKVSYLSGLSILLKKRTH